MRLRSGSTYNSLFGSGSGTRNRPIALTERGPCCQDSPTALSSNRATSRGPSELRLNHRPCLEKRPDRHTAEEVPGRFGALTRLKVTPWRQRDVSPTRRPLFATCTPSTPGRRGRSTCPFRGSLDLSTGMRQHAAWQGQSAEPLVWIVGKFVGRPSRTTGRAWDLHGHPRLHKWINANSLKLRRAYTESWSGRLQTSALPLGYGAETRRDALSP
jgi:hypothetical protein